MDTNAIANFLFLLREPLDFLSYLAEGKKKKNLKKEKKRKEKKRKYEENMCNEVKSKEQKMSVNSEREN